VHNLSALATATRTGYRDSPIPSASAAFPALYHFTLSSVQGSSRSPPIRFDYTPSTAALAAPRLPRGRADAEVIGFDRDLNKTLSLNLSDYSVKL